MVLLLAAAMVAVLLLVYGQGDDDGPARASADDIGAPVDPPVVLIRSGVPVKRSWAERASRVPGVEQALYVRRGQTLLRRVTRTTGDVVQEVRRGYAIPLDTLVAEPQRVRVDAAPARGVGRGGRAPR